MVRKIIFLSLLGIIFCPFFLVNGYSEDLPPLKQMIKKVPHMSGRQAYTLFQQKRLFIIDVHHYKKGKKSKILDAITMPKEKAYKLNCRKFKGKLLAFF